MKSNGKTDPFCSFLFLSTPPPDNIDIFFFEHKNSFNFRHKEPANNLAFDYDFLPKIE